MSGSDLRINLFILWSDYASVQQLQRGFGSVLLFTLTYYTSVYNDNIDSLCTSHVIWFLCLYYTSHVSMQVVAVMQLLPLGRLSVANSNRPLTTLSLIAYFGNVTRSATTEINILQIKSKY